MSSDFDLNIENYNLIELEELFGLDHDNYDSKTVENNYTKLKDEVFSDDSVSKNIYANTVDFLNAAKKILLFELNNSYNNSFKKRYDKIIVEELNKPVKDVYEKKIPEIEIELENTETQTDNGDVNSSVIHPSLIHPSVFYPIKKSKKTVVRHLNIDTRFRKNYSNTLSSNFQVDFSNTFYNVNQMKLTSFEMPPLYYNISKQLGNNFFSIEIVSTGINYIVIIPDGNYTPLSLTNYLNDYITTVSDLDGILQFIYNEDGENYGHIEISVTDDYKYFYFKLIFQNDINGHSDIITPLHVKMGWLLGFKNGTYFGKTSYVSEGVVDLTIYKYVYLLIDDNHENDPFEPFETFEDVNISEFYISPSSSIMNKHILARISCQNNNNNNTNNNNNNNNVSIVSTPRDYYKPVDITNLKIKLMDSYGRILDLNNIDYSFCLTFYSYLPVT